MVATEERYLNAPGDPAFAVHEGQCRSHRRDWP
jgi:hypothetical protein